MELKRLFSLIALFAAFQTVTSQVLYPSHYNRSYWEALRMKNSNLVEPLTYFPSVIHSYASDSTLEWDIWDGRFDISKKEGDYFKVLDPDFKLGYSGLADSYNDGAIWEGRGLNSSFNFGFTGKKGLLHYTLAPVIYYAQNKDFYIPVSGLSKSRFSYPFEDRIDWVLRYGDQSVSKMHLGQSELRLIYKKATIGLSTQSLIWGPARHNQILMSTNAPGIPHLDIGTAKPIDTKIGKIEFRTFWGFMDESEYFDDNPDNDKRYVTGMILGYQPKFIPGLILGLNRVMYRRNFDGDFKAIDLFRALWKKEDLDPFINDSYDQLASATIRWRFEEQGFEAYVEFARNDFPGSLEDLLENPERTRASTLGFIKTFDYKDGNLLQFTFEYTKLNQTKKSLVVPSAHPPYYVHYVVENGYTNLGQLMGSYTGPGSNSHHTRLQYFHKKGMIGIILDRIRYNDDFQIANFTASAVNDSIPADINYRMGIDYMRFAGNFSINLNATYTFNKNWYYESGRDTHHLNGSIRIGYLLNRRED